MSGKTVGENEKILGKIPIWCCNSLVKANMRHEKSTGEFVDFGIDFLKPCKNRFQRHLLCKCEIKILGKAVFTEIASFQRCAALEYKIFANR